VVTTTFVLEGFLDAEELAKILRELSRAESEAAGVYGQDRDGRVDRRVRSAQKVAVSPETCRLVRARFEKVQPVIAAHFGVELQSHEEPQFLRYADGDFFVAHQDGNTPLIWDDSRHRRISAIVFLNEQSAQPMEGSYGGGSLVFHGSYPDFDGRQVVPAVPGALVAFRSETTHEVTPVTYGSRFTIVTWYR
jgi:SM-20-related protein